MEGDTEFWTSHVEACRREGMAASVYARQHGLTLASLYYWRRKLTRAEATGADGTANQFVALRVLAAAAGSVHAPVTAALPPQSLPKSNASPDLLTMLLVVKFIDRLPLARFEYVLARHGVRVPRQTLARWVIGAAGVL